MHVLLLKEPRDGSTGPDPYITVKAISPINVYPILLSSHISVVIV